VTAPVAPMEALKRLRDIVLQLDAAECPALYNQIQGELAVAEMVLRQASPVAPQSAPATETVARFWGAVEAGSHAPQPAMPTLPSTPEDVVEFLGEHIECMDAVGDIEDRRITLSVHDLLSAFQELADAQPAQQVEAVGQINQWRKCGCSDWYDGFPDPEDGGGPYETRKLYATLEPAAQQAGDVVLREAVAKFIKAKGRYHTEQSYAALVAAYDAFTAKEKA